MNDRKREMRELEGEPISTRMPFASSSVEFRRMEELCRLSNMDSKERSLYERELKYYRDKRNQIEYAAKTGLEEGLAKGLAEGLAKGIVKGRAEGRAEGVMEGQANMIRAMINAGMTLSEVSSIVGISESEIRAMIDRFNR